MSEWELELQETNERLTRQVQKMTVDASQTRREALDATAQRDRAQRVAFSILLDCETLTRSQLGEWELDSRAALRDLLTASRGPPRRARGSSRSTTPQPTARGGGVFEDPHSLGVVAPRHHRTNSRNIPSSPQTSALLVKVPLGAAAEDSVSILPNAVVDDAGASPSDEDYDSSDEPSAISSPQLIPTTKPPKLKRPACTINNPNAFGEAVGGPKDKNWYLCEALRQSMIVHMSREHNRVTARAPPVNSPDKAALDEDSDDTGEKPPPQDGNDTQAKTTPPRKGRFALSGFLPSRVAAALPLSRRADIAAQQVDTEESYHVCIKQNRVQSKIGLDDAGYQGPANTDITNRVLRSRFGLDQRNAPTAGETVAPTSPVAPVSNGTSSSSSKKGLPKDYRTDEIAITFHAEDHMRRVRKALEITTESITESCGCRASHWRVVHSPGKSDSMFLYMGHLVAKSVNEAEFKLLTTELLADLAPYTEKNPYTLLPRFSMLFTVTWLKTKKSTKLPTAIRSHPIRVCRANFAKHTTCNTHQTEMRSIKTHKRVAKSDGGTTEILFWS